MLSINPPPPPPPLLPLDDWYYCTDGVLVEIFTSVRCALLKANAEGEVEFPRRRPAWLRGLCPPAREMPIGALRNGLAGVGPHTSTHATRQIPIRESVAIKVHSCLWCGTHTIARLAAVLGTTVALAMEIQNRQ